MAVSVARMASHLFAQELSRQFGVQKSQRVGAWFDTIAVLAMRKPALNLRLPGSPRIFGTARAQPRVSATDHT